MRYTIARKTHVFEGIILEGLSALARRWIMGSPGFLLRRARRLRLRQTLPRRPHESRPTRPNTRPHSLDHLRKTRKPPHRKSRTDRRRVKCARQTCADSGAIAESRDTRIDRVSETPESLNRIILMAIGGAKDAIVKQLLAIPETIFTDQALLACAGVKAWCA